MNSNLRKEQILSAAIQLFNDHQPDGVSLNELAQAVGISRPALYQYFTDKDDIVASASKVLHSEVIQKAQRQLATSYPLARRVLNATLDRELEFLRVTLENKSELPWFLDTTDAKVHSVFKGSQREFTTLIRKEMKREGCDNYSSHSVSKSLVASAYGQRLFAQSAEELETMISTSIPLLLENAFSKMPREPIPA